MNQESRTESYEKEPASLRELIGTDERFTSLRNEIAQSVYEVMEQGLAMNIAPLRGLMEKSLGEAGYAVMSEEAPSLFFDVAIKDAAFPKIYHAIGNDVAERKYDDARQKVKQMTKRLAGALGGAEDENLRRVRGEFDAWLPEDVSALLNPESLEARARRGQRGVTRTNELASERKERESEELFWKPYKETKSLAAKERTWGGPTLEDIKPGCILEVERENMRDVIFKTFFEITGEPFQEKDFGWWVKANLLRPDRTVISKEVISLGDQGVTAYPSGFWHATHRPLRIYPKTEQLNL